MPVVEPIVTRYGFNSRIIRELIVYETSANQSAFNKVIRELNAPFANYSRILRILRINRVLFGKIRRSVVYHPKSYREIFLQEGRKGESTGDVGPAVSERREEGSGVGCATQRQKRGRWPPCAKQRGRRREGKVWRTPTLS